MSNIQIDDEVMDILKRSTIDGISLKLPAGLLPRPLYDRVNKVITFSGGKWNRGTQSHIFTDDPRKKLGLVIETGVAVDEKKLFQAFWTPPALAAEVVQLANVYGQRVLEPSAGRGALVEACAKAGAVRVECIDLNPANVEYLITEGLRTVQQGDFLKMTPPKEKFLRIVMNPPFTKGQDLKHLTHALRWLEPGGILVAIVSAGLSDEKIMEAVEGFSDSYEVTRREVPAGAFKESGTEIRTSIIRIHPC